jgi:2-polyprenyl-3-methyl-5-hydroxy-6-metoxy-1,4-benzoquinol methylase
VKATEAVVDLAGLACPACRSPLSLHGDEVACDGCGRRFPVVAGIPELRLDYPDPYLTREEDVARARELEARFDELDFAGLLREHWRRSGKPPELADRFLAGDLASLARSEAYLEEIESHYGARLAPDDRFLEIGCGTAGLAAAASARGSRVTAGDLSMRWLVLARKRLSEEGVDSVRLVCFAAERPPFAAGSFDVAAASDVIEHVSSQEAFAEGCREVLRPGGILFLATPNRFSLGLEPHVRLWGVGFLPRPLAKRYVRAVRKAPYDHVRLLSAPRLRRVLRRHGFAVEIVPPEIPSATAAMYRGLELRLVGRYNRLRQFAAARRVLIAVGPFFHVFARKGA